MRLFVVLRDDGNVCRRPSSEVAAVCTTVQRAGRFIALNPHPHCTILEVIADTFYGDGSGEHQTDNGDEPAREGTPPGTSPPLMNDA